MRCLITGCAGFVGRRFARRLLDEGHNVVGVDNLVAGISPEKWAFKPQSWEHFRFDKSDVRMWFKDNRPDDFDLIIHCAAIVGGRLKIDGDPLAVATDLSIDSEFFNWAVRAKTKPTVIYFSSSAVYPLNLQTREHNCLLSEALVNFDGPYFAKPDQTYGFAKMCGEYLAKFAAEHYGLNVKVYRPFGGYGEDQSLDYPFPSIIKRVLDKENPIVVWGSGEQRRDFIYIEDIIDAVFQTMEHLPPAEPLNLGMGIATSFYQLAAGAASVLGLRADIVNDSTRPEGVFARVADVTKLHGLCKPKYELFTDGIQKVANFMFDKERKGL